MCSVIAGSLLLGTLRAKHTLIYYQALKMDTSDFSFREKWLGS